MHLTARSARGHTYLRSSEGAVLAGRAVVRSLSALLNEAFRPRLVIAHGGNGLLLKPGERILSYATRGMEPLRGFPEFMRMLPARMERFDDLQVVIAGRDRVAYSYQAPSHGGSWKKRFFAELRCKLNRSRLHFTGLLNYGDYVVWQQVDGEPRSIDRLRPGESAGCAGESGPTAATAAECR